MNAVSTTTMVLSMASQHWHKLDHSGGEPSLRNTDVHVHAHMNKHVSVLLNCCSMKVNVTAFYN